MKATVDAQIELVANRRARKYASELGKPGRAWLNRENTPLVVALIAGEEESAILADRPAELIAELLPLEERIRIVEITLKAWIRGHVIVSVEIKSAAVSVVAARASNNVDRAIAC